MNCLRKPGSQLGHLTAGGEARGRGGEGGDGQGRGVGRELHTCGGEKSLFVSMKLSSNQTSQGQNERRTQRSLNQVL